MIFVPRSVVHALENMKTEQSGAVRASRARAALLDETNTPRSVPVVAGWHPCFAHAPEVKALLVSIAGTMHRGKGVGRGAEVWLALDQRFIESTANFDDSVQYEKLVAELPYIERTLHYLFEERNWAKFQKAHSPECVRQLAARLASIDARLRHPLWTLGRFDLRQRIAEWLLELLSVADAGAVADDGIMLSIAESGWYTSIVAASATTQRFFGVFEQRLAKIVSETPLHKATTDRLRLAALYHRGLARRAMSQGCWERARGALHEALGALAGARWEGFAIGARGDLASCLYAERKFEPALVTAGAAVAEARGLVHRSNNRAGTRRLLVEGTRLMLVGRRTGDASSTRDAHGGELLETASSRPNFEPEVQASYLRCLEGSNRDRAPATLPLYLT